MENCARENCGHPREENHPDDGACTAEGCECHEYVAPAEEQAGAGTSGGGVRETPEQELVRLRAENRSLRVGTHAEMRKRIAAEVEKVTTPLRSRTDVRYNVGEITILGNVLTVAKAAAAGLPSIAVPDGEGKTREVPVNVKSIGAFFTAQVQSLISGDAKFDVPTGTLQQPAAPTGGVHRSTVTAGDFAKAGVDPAAAQRISDEIDHRKRTNPTFTRADLEREVARR